MKKIFLRSAAAALLLCAGIDARAQQAIESNELLREADELATAVMARLFDQNGDQSNTSDGRIVWELSSWFPPADLGPATTIQHLDEPVDRMKMRFGDIK